MRGVSGQCACNFNKWILNCLPSSLGLVGLSISVRAASLSSLYVNRHRQVRESGRYKQYTIEIQIVNKHIPTEQYKSCGGLSYIMYHVVIVIGYVNPYKIVYFVWHQTNCTTIAVYNIL